MLLSIKTLIKSGFNNKGAFMYKVSVIIPVYNAKNYMRRCLDSVCNQTLKDIEIICVNDCSTDNSIEILNEYAEKYPNVKVIDCQVNGGESVARNIGLDNAGGEYLAFVDNDDEIDLDFCEKLYRKAVETGADIVKGNVFVDNYEGKRRKSNLNDLIRQYGSKLHFSHYWWSAIYKTPLIRENNIRFLEHCPLGGDVLFLNQAILKCHKLCVIDDAFYFYYMREDSGDSKILSFDKIKSLLDINEKILDNLVQCEDLNKLSKEGVNSLFTRYLQSVLNCCYRCKSLEALDYAIDKIFLIYAKINKFIPDSSNIYGLIMDTLRQHDKEELKKLYLKYNTAQKMFIANLRYMCQK